MEKRINIQQVQPNAYKAMLALETYLAQTSLSKKMKELIKIRASQINGCAFCIDMHSKDALKDGESGQRILLLQAWRETGTLFTDAEKAALALTEEVTHISEHGLTASTYQYAAQHYADEQIGEIIMAIVTINAWNRIAISTRMEIGSVSG